MAKNNDPGPYSPKTGRTDAKVHCGAGHVGKDYGIAKNAENVPKIKGSSK